MKGGRGDTWTTLRKRVLRIARELLSLPTAPFREHRVREYVKAFCAARGIATWEDDMGNVVAVYGARRRGPVLAFDAHMDHPGFIIEKDSRRRRSTKVPKRKSLRFEAPAVFYGGVEKEYFRGTRVRVFTEGGEVTGRVLAAHFRPRKRIKRILLALDGEVKQGDVATWDLPPFRVRGDRLHARSCDDLVGCVSLLALFDELARRRVPRKVLGVFTVAEESGLNGAKYLALARRIPKTANLVAVETSRELPTAPVGGGAVIRVGDRESIFSPSITRFMEHVAGRLRRKSPSFRCQRKLMDGGLCEASVYQAFGYRCGAACVALGNYHNRDFRAREIAPEYVSVSDLVNMVTLFVGMVEGSPELPRFLARRPPKYSEERRGLGERLFR